MPFSQYKNGIHASKAKIILRLVFINFRSAQDEIVRIKSLLIEDYSQWIMKWTFTERCKF